MQLAVSAPISDKFSSDFRCFGYQFFKGISNRIASVLCIELSLEISFFFGFRSNPRTLRIVRILCKYHIKLTWRTLRERPPFENAAAKNGPENTTKKHRKFMKNVTKNHFPFRTRFGIDFLRISGCFFDPFGTRNRPKSAN